MPAAPLVFDVARGSEVDGPGLRTSIFFKGCPLRCVWCHNPESHHFAAEIGFFESRCIRCGTCEQVCPRGAVGLDAPGRIRRSACDLCGICADTCDSLALRRIGRECSEDELLELVLRDRTFFDVSGGGVTFSGGEPLVHLGFLGPLARRLREEGVHVAVETCGHFDYPRFRRELLPWVDCILYDLKIIDPAAHRRLTGRGNERILANFAALAAEEGTLFRTEPDRARPPWPSSARRTVVVPRIPLIPGLTATPDNLAAIADFLRSLGVRSYVLLRYNPSGCDKWAQLGRTPPPQADDKPMPLEEELRLRAEFEDLMTAPPFEPEQIRPHPGPRFVEARTGSG